MKTEKSCNNCIYSIPDWTNVCNSDHYCSNEESEEYGYNAEYLNGCDEWKSIEPNLGNTGCICTKTGGNDEDRTTGDTIYRQAAIDEIKEIYEWHDNVTKERIIEHFEKLPSAQPERTCVNCGRTVNNGGWYADGGTRCPIEEHYALPKDGYCHLWEKRNITDDDYPERRTDE